MRLGKSSRSVLPPFDSTVFYYENEYLCKFYYDRIRNSGSIRKLTCMPMIA